MDRAILIHNIRLLRTENNLTQTELNNRLNFNTGRLMNIENNPNVKIHPQEIISIAQYFDKDPIVLTTIKGVVTFKTQGDGQVKKESETY